GDRLIVRHDNSGSLTNADLAAGFVSGETDVSDVFTVTSGNTLQVASGYELYVDTVGSYAPGADVHAHDLDINGVMDMGGNTIMVNGSFDATGGAFSTTGTVMFTSTNAETITSAGNPFNDVIINDGLVGFWRFEESIGNTCSNGVDDSCDLSGNRYHGFWNGAPAPSTTVTTTIKHSNDRSISLDGTSDYIAIRDLHYTEIGELDEITACAWINTTDTAGSIIDFDRSEYFSLSINFSGCASGEVQWALTNSSAAINDHCSVATYNDGVWHHVCGVFDSSLTNDSIIYVDGVAESVDAFTTGTPVGSGTDRWGYIGDGSEADVFNDSDPNNIRFAGLIDEVRLYHRALSAAEIQRLANGDTPRSALGAYTLQDNLDINGTLLILAGTLDVGSNRQINLSGNWANFGGAFEAQSGGVVFDGQDQVLLTSETFYDVTKTLAAAPSRTLTFGERSTVTVNGSLDLSGYSKPNRLLLRSGDSGVRFNVDMINGNDTVNMIDIEDSEVSTNNIRALDSIDGTNTDSGESAPHWIFDIKGPLKGAIIIVD
ncbi:MAG: LamG domain-containing protein, partial [Candidatus Omnitrophica bacterium]|nr:LamG domain-containing protein [Candidatus Omnitrophota bacterium]